MEDVMASSVCNERSGGKRGRDEEEDQRQVVEVEEMRGEKRGGGFLNQIMSNFGSSNEAGSGDHDQDQNGDVAGGFKKEEDLGGGGGGIISNLISNVFHHGESGGGGGGGEEIVDSSGDQEREKVVEDEEGGGGIVKNFISNIFRHGEGGGGEEEERKKVVDDGGGGGGVIDNIGSHLPKPLAENAGAPATDEASILIHSIIHD